MPNTTIRVTEIDGQPWFVASDVCKVLGLVNITNALLNLILMQVQNYRVPGTRGRLNKIIDEAGLYKMIMRSDKPQARAFQDWVTATVLPAIRKDGEARSGRTTSTTTKHQRRSHVFHGSSRCIQARHPSTCQLEGTPRRPCDHPQGQSPSDQSRTIDQASNGCGIGRQGGRYVVRPPRPEEAISLRSSCGTATGTHLVSSVRPSDAVAALARTAETYEGQAYRP
ncbi:hypothetical protein HGG71_02860 [Rhodobacteraceae bacterium R_SAG2]|nr:hypothetical protein [Rhodobacteraceae bacterium R_SAG2]